MPKSAHAQFNARLLFSIPFWAVGLWMALRQRAEFTFGGDPDSPVRRDWIPVDASGLDAIAIGCAFIAVGIVNLAIGIRGDRRIPVFWIGVVLLAATAVYGIAQIFI
jgi:hypothetical protein